MINISGHYASAEVSDITCIIDFPTEHSACLLQRKQDDLTVLKNLLLQKLWSNNPEQNQMMSVSQKPFWSKDQELVSQKNNSCMFPWLKQANVCPSNWNYTKNNHTHLLGLLCVVSAICVDALQRFLSPAAMWHSEIKILCCVYTDCFEYTPCSEYSLHSICLECIYCMQVGHSCCELLVVAGYRLASLQKVVLCEPLLYKKTRPQITWN